jgi:predicted metalloprotease with PDZ domain
LALQRAGLTDLTGTARTLTGLVETVTQDYGRQVRSAEQMSQMAPFIDGGRTIDRTNWSNTVISYYPFGGAVALAMDLSLRDRTDGRVSLDDFMRAMWRKYGQPGGGREGYVDRPYTIADAEATLAEVSSDQQFAREFFSRYIQGHDVADYGRLLARAGFSLRRASAGRAWLGDVRFDFRNGARVAALVSPAWPLYAAGIDQDDEVQQLDGQAIKSDTDVAAVLARHKPGDQISILFLDRTGVPKNVPVTLKENPHLEVVPVESPSSAQQAFRDRWIKSRS